MIFCDYGSFTFADYEIEKNCTGGGVHSAFFSAFWTFLLQVIVSFSNQKS